MDADHYNPERTQGIVYVEPVAAADPANAPGVSDPINAGYCLKSLEHALNGINDGRFRALVTGPVNKGTIRDAGFHDFTGHTEFLRDFYGLSEVVMMLSLNRLPGRAGDDTPSTQRCPPSHYARTCSKRHDHCD